MSIRDRQVLTAPRSPRQNAFVERVIGSIRRDCPDHVVVLNERHLKRILTGYFGYYHRWRTHLSLEWTVQIRERCSSGILGRSYNSQKSVVCIIIMSGWQRNCVRYVFS